MAPLVKDRKSLIGIILIAVGSLLFMHQTGFWWLPPVIYSWQAILVWIGIFAFLTSDNRYSGLVMIGIGVFFYLAESPLFFFIRLENFWPLLLVIIGVLTLVNRKQRKLERAETEYNQPNASDYTEDGYLKKVAFFAGAEQMVFTDNFKGGSLTAIFGGVKIDLLDAELAEGVNVLTTTALFGGWELIIPAHWKLDMEVVPVLGGLTDSRQLVAHDLTDNTRKLIIKGIAVFGGGEVKSERKLE